MLPETYESGTLTLYRAAADQRRTARDMDALLESVSLSIRCQFSLTAQIPEPDVTARTMVRDRFRQFIDQVGCHIANSERRVADPASVILP